MLTLRNAIKVVVHFFWILVALTILCISVVGASISVAQTERVEIVLQAGHSTDAKAAIFSPNGKNILTAGDQTARLWDVATGREIRRFDGHSSLVLSIAFSSDGSKVLTGSADETARLWNVADGRELLKLTHGSIVFSVAFSPDGRTALTGSHDTMVRLWDLTTGRELLRFEGHSKGVKSAIFSPDGSKILTGSVDNTVRLWDIQTRRELRRFQVEMEAWGIVVAFSLDGRSVLTGSADKTARLWDTSTGRELRKFEGNLHPVVSVAFSPDGRTLITGSYDGTARLWEVASGRELRQFERNGQRVASVAFSPDGLTALTGSERIRLWDIATGSLVQTFEGRLSPVSDVAFSPDGRTALIGSWERAARFWDLSTGRELRKLVIDVPFLTSRQVYAVAFSPDGRTALTGSQDYAARLWDVSTGQELRKFEGHSNVMSVGFSPDGKTLITGGYDNTARLWDVATGRELHRLEGNSSPVITVAFSPDGRTVLVGGNKEMVGLWDVSTGRQLRQFGGTSVAFSPNGRNVLTGSHDKRARIWDVASGRELQRFEGHSNSVTQAVYSPDGRTVLTASWDRTARIWNVASGQELRKFEGHSERVSSVAFSPNAETILTGSGDGTTRLWTSNGSARVSFVGFKDGSWLTVTPEGFFDASSRKAAQNLNIVRGLEVYSIDQVYDALYRPDLVREKLAGDPNGKVSEAAAKLDLTKVIISGGAPKVAITSHKDGTSISSGEVTVNADVAEQGGGVGKIEWRLNGQTVGVDTRGFKRVEGAGAAASPPSPAMTVSQKLAIEPGDNVIEVVAYNAQGVIASVPAKVALKGIGKAEQAKPRLFVLSVGVNDYLDGRLRLKFAASDARAIAASFEKAGSGFYEAVKVKTVLDTDVTAAKLEAAFRDLSADVKPSDVFVFFVAGHGRTLNGKYYFIPQDFRYRDQDSYAQSAVSQDQWQRWFSQVKAKKSILIYDTCESGSVTADTFAVASRGPLQVEEQAVAYEKLRQATGRTVLAASTDTQPALEGYRGHGVLSYAVMDAIERGPANANGLVEVTGLIGYVDTQVPELSFQAFKQRQFPQAKFNGSNFPLVRRTAVLGNLPPAPATSGQQSQSTPTASIPTKPTHVVIAPVAVRQTGAPNAPTILQLPVGSQVAIIERQGKWILVARDGKQIGYVEEKVLATLQ